MILLGFWAIGSKADEITCAVEPNGSVVIEMSHPHPGEAVVRRPTGETVWLQSETEFVAEQGQNLPAATRIMLRPDSLGTVWVDGKAEVQRVVSGAGEYKFYAAENVETEPDNTYHVECRFYIQKGDNKAGQKGLW